MSHRQTLESVLARCVRNKDGCLVWSGFKNPRGYGRTKFINRNWLVHRLVWELTIGPITPGMTLDHTCHNEAECSRGDACIHRACCNVAHLREVSARVNTLAGNTIPAVHAAKTHCHRGHEFTRENTYRFGPDKRWRQCKACRSL